MVLVTGSGPLRPEISVMSFDPALTVATPDVPSKVLGRGGLGRMPTRKVGGFRSLKKPPPTPGSTIKELATLLLTTTSGLPSPVTSATAVPTGPSPALRRGPGTRLRVPLVDWLSKIDTSLEPLLATTRSGRPSPF